MLKPDHKFFCITWVNSQNKVLIAYRTSKTVAEALSSFYTSHPAGDVVNIREVS